MPLLTVQEVSQRLGLDESQVRRRCRAGTLRAIKKGRDWLIEEKFLEKAQPHAGTGPKSKKEKHLR